MLPPDRPRRASDRRPSPRPALSSRFLARRVLELIVGINMLVALFQQWIIPSVRNSLEPFSVSDAPRRCSRDSDFFCDFLFIKFDTLF